MKSLALWNSGTNVERKSKVFPGRGSRKDPSRKRFELHSTYKFMMDCINVTQNEKGLSLRCHEITNGFLAGEVLLLFGTCEILDSHEPYYIRDL